MQPQVGSPNKLDNSYRYTLVGIFNRIHAIKHFKTLNDLFDYCKKHPVRYPLRQDRIIWDNLEKKFIRTELRKELL